MSKKRKIELLAPAKNLECGLAAIIHGADAVYIGATNFGARASAGNSISDIKQLCDYAHLFGVKIYVTLNTILSDTELVEAEQLIWDLWENANIDALIIQDFGITKLHLPPIPLHASTQMDNRSVEKVSFLESVGFQQVVLPREMTIEEIKQISSQVRVPLEFFIHGAICVSYSGQCFISQAISKRSANKGSCAQYCRLPYTLKDANDQSIVDSKHLLSMKDMNLSNDLERLLDAGISSLKIEGRMKDVTYVKNTVSFYRKKLDDLFAKSNQYEKSSYGFSEISFQPDLSKSFNRSFSTYFLNGRGNESRNMWTLDSPKSIGEQIGIVIKTNNGKVYIDSQQTISNGDGLCYFDENKELKGLNVNAVENNIIKTTEIISANTIIYRNRNHKFESEVNRNNSAQRFINVHFDFRDTLDGFLLKAYLPDVNLSIDENFIHQKEKSKTNQIEKIKDTLSKTGNTIFKVSDINVDFSDDFFIPLSTLAEWRRKLTDKFPQTLLAHYDSLKDTFIFEQTTYPYPSKEIDYRANVMNTKALEFYKDHGCKVTEQAFEVKSKENVPLMFTRHCIKYSLGMCHKNRTNKEVYKEPFKLIYKNIILRLEFDCKNCEMKIHKHYETEK